MFRPAFFWVAVVSMTSTAFADGDAENGKVLIKSWGCTECHGLTGNDRSARDFPVPMLAGQPAAFTVKRLMQYKSMTMENDKTWERMRTFAQGLSVKDMSDIGAYYEQQKRY